MIGRTKDSNQMLHIDNNACFSWFLISNFYHGCTCKEDEQCLSSQTLKLRMSKKHKWKIFNGIFLRSNQWESSSQPSNIALPSYRLSFFTIFHALWLLSLITTNLFLPSQISSSPFSVLKIYPGQLSKLLSQISLSTYTAEAICEHIDYIVFQRSSQGYSRKK